MEEALPEGVAQNCYRGSAGNIFLAAEFPAELRGHT